LNLNKRKHRGREQDIHQAFILGTKTVKSTPRALEGIHDIKSSDGFTVRILSVGDEELRSLRHHLPLSVLGISNRVTDDILEEDLEDTAGFFIDETGDTLDTTTASETTNSRFGDTCNVAGVYIRTRTSERRKIEYLGYCRGESCDDA
jgi:hypothetical protein